MKKRTEDASHTIIQGIAEIKGIPECDIEPLYNSVEPELLNKLMRHSQRYQSDLSIEFTHEGCTVLVRTDKEIKITSDLLNDE
ncbi:HalOD1 output domain-containing protein [Natronorubrum bangense]|uniref:HalOD1 output domain-containing protein n=1 Tax=Natronorubrum bangense TaxID=61858 RepID=UPI001268DEEA|nr:HalOD1 output domain-containing protein [Natronorubrum bangense]